MGTERGDSAPPSPPDATNRVRRRIAVLITALAVTYWVVFSGQLPVLARHLDPWWVPFVVMTGLPASAYLLVATIRGSAAMIRRATTVFATTYLVLCVAWFAAVDGDHVPMPASTWLEGWSTISAVAAAISWRIRTALMYAFTSFAFSRAIHYLQVEDPDPRWVVVSVAGNLLLTLVLTVLSRLAVDAAAQVDASWAHHHTESAREAARHARAVERERVADLLHDYVLAALLAGAKQPDGPEIRREAEAAVRALDAESPVEAVTPWEPGRAVREIAARCRRPHPSITVREQVTASARRCPSDVVDLLADGAREAVRNSFRHGGPDPTVTVTIRCGTDLLDVEIADDGPGFGESPSEGFGLSRLGERVAATPGASLSLDTRGGAVVRLAWRDPGVETGTRSPGVGFRELLHLSGRQVWTATGVFVVAILASAVSYAHTTTPIAIQLVAAAVTIAATVPLLVARDDPLPWQASGLVTLGLPTATLLIVLTSSAPIPSQVTWPTYLVGSFSMVLAVRGRIVAAGVVTVACLAPPLLLAERTGRTLDYWIPEAISSFMCLLLCYFFATTIRPAMRRIRRLRDESARGHADLAARQARTVQRQRHLATIERLARPLLVTMTHRALSPGERRTAANLEARLRATLRAPGLSHPSLDDAVDRARTRGAHVVLIDDSAITPFGDTREFDRFLRTVDAELAAAGNDHTITVRLTPAHHRHRATIVTTRGGATVSRVEVDDTGRAAAPRARGHHPSGSSPRVRESADAG